MTLRDNDWSLFNEQGARIEKVVSDIEGEGIIDYLRGWQSYLEQEINFPVEVKVQKWEEHKWPLTTGDQVNLVGLFGVEDDIYGVIAEVVTPDKEKEFIPLCELKPKTEKNKVIDDYGVWFANCR